MKPLRPNTALIGIAGVHHTVAELSRRRRCKIRPARCDHADQGSPLNGYTPTDLATRRRNRDETGLTQPSNAQFPVSPGCQGDGRHARHGGNRRPSKTLAPLGDPASTSSVVLMLAPDSLQNPRIDFASSGVAGRHSIYEPSRHRAERDSEVLDGDRHAVLRRPARDVLLDDSERIPPTRNRTTHDHTRSQRSPHREANICQRCPRW